MKTKDEVMEIIILNRQGMGIRAIARELKISRNTVRKYLRNQIIPSYKSSKQKLSKLDNYKSYIEKRLRNAKNLKIPATVIYKEIKSLGYKGKITILREYIHKLKKIIPEKIIRFETNPGEQMQVDWASFKKGQLSAFVAVMGYSRKAYVEFVENEKLESLLNCHKNAFEFFGGIPKNILYDNMKTVVIKRNAYGEKKHQLQKQFRDFAKHYGFIPRLCRPYRAQTKGKVERFISYLRHSFYNPLITKQDDMDLSYLNYLTKIWLEKEANIRIHQTTKEKPQILFYKEQDHLLTLPFEYKYSMPEKFSNEEFSKELQHSLSVYERLAKEEVV
jgi:transposase